MRVFQGVVQRGCREYDIPLRKSKRIRLEGGDEMLQRLYLAEDRNIAEIANAVGYCYSTVYKRVKRFGLVKE